MSLFNKLLGTEEPNLSAHAICAFLFEVADGELTKQNVFDYWLEGAEPALVLGTDDETEYDFLVNAYQASTDKEHFKHAIERIIMVARKGVPGYTTREDIQARISRLI